MVVIHAQPLMFTLYIYERGFAGQMWRLHKKSLDSHFLYRNGVVRGRRADSVCERIARMPLAVEILGCRYARVSPPQARQAVIGLSPSKPGRRIPRRFRAHRADRRTSSART